ncbi:diacylglycerol kinase family protein [Sporolactobacillus terrae]|uniref:Diacylglycerol kinase n=1 Tax=Sporolactobacillus terrae TaxID=269673 RepID=A0A410D9Q9_9BACL|nr:diacylglycerol kinase family protein [Sporolactobacillus terrae]QAA22829.1 diacylglycerol kinase [Sporolactobacillus terrae]QAA25803.1 diacylglycerol kinase [Sporolactobacillus terrae]UAK17680.1 diacylglycerol kinase family protein [Sporolactobacillus terrae]BBN99225.1 diacylglycerol kinase [Sporolactobacillus terrae]
MNGRHLRVHKRLFESFKDAISGFLLALAQERNLKIQLAAAVLVLCFSWSIRVSLIYLVIIFVLIGGVISLELINTAVERLVDLVTKENHPIAKAAKDTAAAAVWWFSVMAAVIFIVIVCATLFH